MLFPEFLLIAGGALVATFARAIQRFTCKQVNKLVGPPFNERDAAGITLALVFVGLVWMGVGMWLLVENL